MNASASNTPIGPVLGFLHDDRRPKEKNPNASPGEHIDLRNGLLLRALDLIQERGSLTARQAKFLLQRQRRETVDRIIDLLLKTENEWVPRGSIIPTIWKTIAFDPIRIGETQTYLRERCLLSSELDQSLLDNHWDATPSSIEHPTEIHLVRINAHDLFGSDNTHCALGSYLTDDALERVSWDKLSSGNLHTLPIDLALQLTDHGVFATGERVVIATPSINDHTKGPAWRSLGFYGFVSGALYPNPCFEIRRDFEAGGMKCCNADVIFQFVPDPPLTEPEAPAIEAHAD